jgi:glycine/D-amino acid oxidase-like deaminating enzyme
VLLAPLTGECVAALAVDEEPPLDLAPFRVERFAA